MPASVSQSIVIATGAPLCRNPRVVKEATALAEAGYRVTVLRPVLDAGWAARDAQIAAVAPFSVMTTADLTASAPASLFFRAERFIGGRGFATLPYLAPRALGYGVMRTIRLARQLRGDLVIGHQEVGLAVAEALARDGQRTGVDIEDWYSEDLLPEARVHRPVAWLARAENAAVRRGGMVTTTSHALAEALADASGGPAPAVVYNVFPWSDREALDGEARDRPPGDASLPSLHWVSQTIGPGRGLEELCDALTLVDTPVQLHLRGDISAADEAWLRGRFPSARGHRLHLHGLVAPSELLSRIAEHDIGLALEAVDPPSRNLTVTNKMFHYLLAGLAVVATRTAGQAEIAASVPAAIATCRPGDAASLAAAINELVSDPARLAAAHKAALDAARDTYCWERQKATVLGLVAAALDAPPAKPSRPAPPQSK
ncbi:glycosyltransferase [Erythrobacter arachoides]|uniref:Glycosyltransferase n=1 Tax=Aurantiacibacter arachoides TaxID=1850444 RepID=A0A844ZVZ7_9SPHN|nr:glycosyltransferase [Aurantiacibacter arachoides]MXO92471.1 glycosyltransferase [Aurantiacibacter arachoides]GGD56915.1 hypothetical protein GCM10011411_16180 [Aurantiacibacter arachoides]